MYKSVQVTEERKGSASSSPEIPNYFQEHEAPKRRRKSWTYVFISQLLGVLWLAPIGTLLFLNFKGYIIGASAWCPGKNCSADQLGDDAIMKAQRLDKDDHNTLGALQFVAKALEVWFMYIATSMVYEVAMLFAKRGGGLPIGFLMTHLEFADLRSLLDPILWTSAAPHEKAYNRRQWNKILLYLFVILVALMCILANLMGPATAILVLPSLQWISTAPQLGDQFYKMGSADPPSGDTVFPTCDAATLSAGGYSCTAPLYASSLDSWVASANASIGQSEMKYGYLSVGISPEDAVTFTINATDSDLLAWAPNRQVLRDLSEDFVKFANLTQGKPSPAADLAYNNSLQTILQRHGPSMGVQLDCFTGNVSTTMVSDDQQVRCLSGWTQDYESYYTKCIRVGQGWSDSNAFSSFFLGNVDSDIKQTSVDVFFSDKAAFFNSTTHYGSSPSDCLGNPEAPSSCDWDAIFSADLPSNMKNSSVNVNVIEYGLPNPPNLEARAWCDSTSYVSFPVYSLDTSGSSNPLYLVQLDQLGNLSHNPVPAILNPDWFLAAWSVDQNGTVDRDRLSATELSRVLPIFYAGNDDEDEFSIIQIYVFLQTLSMVDYFSNATSSASTSAPIDDAHPIFTHSALIHVWAYSLNGRTSYLGVVVVGLGAICVLIRTILGITHGAHQQDRSTVELVVAALEHQPLGEFEGLHGEKKLAKVRYEMRDEGGKIKFVPEVRADD